LHAPGKELSFPVWTFLDTIHVPFPQEGETPPKLRVFDPQKRQSFLRLIRAQRAAFFLDIQIELA